MSAAVVISGWLAAAGALAAAALGARDRRRRMELVARAGHELRGPIAAARLGLQTLARGIAREPGTLDAIERELRRAGLALEDLVAAQAGRRAADRVETVEVGALLRDAAAAWRPVAYAMGRELALDWRETACYLRGDRVRLAQALGNLIGNALEHGAGRVTLRGRGGLGCVRIEVADDGEGLSVPLERLARGARAGRGRRGRGLAIASEIARRHGGRLSSAPSAGGARIALELPVAA
jgi:signal transduction histidine kinase